MNPYIQSKYLTTCNFNERNWSSYVHGEGHIQENNVYCVQCYLNVFGEPVSIYKAIFST